MGFPQRLKELRLSKNISQAALSRELGIPRSSISHYEDESQDDKEIRLPRRERLEQIADFFDVSVDYLLGRTDVRKQTLSTSYETGIVREAGVTFETSQEGTTSLSKILFASNYPHDIQSLVLGMTSLLETMGAEQRADVIAELKRVLDSHVPQV